MKSLTLEMQLSLFAAAGSAFAAVSRLSPPDPKALSACGFLTAAIAPTFEELWAYSVANGLPRPDAKDYSEMLAAAQRFAASVLEAGETQH